MKNILVSGLINIEVTLQIESFPLSYFPVCYPFNAISSSVSGVGFNVASALTSLGSNVSFLSLTGNDSAGSIILEALKKLKIKSSNIIKALDNTPHSVIIYDREGKRQIHVDLKNIQETEYPPAMFDKALQECSFAVLCNINFSRPMLDKCTSKGIPIATDIHAISCLEDKYNMDFISASTILFMSNELLPCPPDEWMKRLINRYSPEIIVIGLGKHGALLYEKANNSILHFPAAYTRPVVNTIGAGDALFSSFIHFYVKTGNAAEAVKMAQYFASYKIGSTGAADGFLTEKELLGLIKRTDSFNQS